MKALRMPDPRGKEKAWGPVWLWCCVACVAPCLCSSARHAAWSEALRLCVLRHVACVVCTTLARTWCTA